MIKFAELFPDVEIRATVSHELEKSYKIDAYATTRQAYQSAS